MKIPIVYKFIFILLIIHIISGIILYPNYWIAILMISIFYCSLTSSTMIQIHNEIKKRGKNLFNMELKIGKGSKISYFSTTVSEGIFYCFFGLIELLIVEFQIGLILIFSGILFILDSLLLNKKKKKRDNKSDSIDPINFILLDDKLLYSTKDKRTIGPYSATTMICGFLFYLFISFLIMIFNFYIGITLIIILFPLISLIGDFYESYYITNNRIIKFINFKKYLEINLDEISYLQIFSKNGIIKGIMIIVDNGLNPSYTGEEKNYLYVKINQENGIYLTFTPFYDISIGEDFLNTILNNTMIKKHPYLNDIYLYYSS